MRPPWLESLELTAEQQPAAQAIFDRHHTAMQAIIKESFPRVQAINETMENELRTLLTAEQVKRLEEMKRQRPMGLMRPDGPGRGPPERPGPPPPGGPPPPPPGE